MEGGGGVGEARLLLPRLTPEPRRRSVQLNEHVTHGVPELVMRGLASHVVHLHRRVPMGRIPRGG